MARSFADCYYDFVIGQSVCDEYYKATCKFFDYLKDAGLTDKDIYRLMSDLPIRDFLTIEDLYDDVWDNSLLNRNTFYFHKELQIISPPPTWEESFPFYLEIKIKYTLDDLLDYFIKRSGIREEWVNRDKEKGSIKYLLNDYKKFKFIEPIDFLLHLIDFAISKGKELNSIYDVQEFEVELAKFLEIDIANARAKNKDKVVWR